MVTSTSCSYKGPGFDSQHHMEFIIIKIYNHYIAPVLGNPVPSPDLCGRQMYIWCIYIYVGQTFRYMK